MEHISKSQIKLVRSLQHKKFRDELGLFVAEGHKCIDELKKRFEPYLLISPDNASEQEIAQMSSLKTPQGAIGIFHQHAKRDQAESNGIRLVLDGIQDPGNLGTIIRTCDWFGVREIICSADTADCFNPKVVQATMGALARVGLTYTKDLPTWLDEQKRNGIPVIGTLLEGKEMYKVFEDIAQDTGSKTGTKHNCLIVMGNEGNGISPTVRERITYPIRIPSFPPGEETSESLNVSIATAIVLAELRRCNIF